MATDSSAVRPVNNDNRGWAGGAVETLGCCPVCRATSRHQVHTGLKDWFFECSDDEWTLWCCEQCQTFYLDPRPDNASIGYAYRRYYTHADDVENKPVSLLDQVIWSLVNGYLNHRFGLERKPAWAAGFWIFSILLPFRFKLDYYGRHLSVPSHARAAPRLLDVGCGSGAFLLRAAEMGWAPTGVEFDPQAVEVCRKQKLEVYCGDIGALPPQSVGFDIITLNHTLEHLPDPMDTLRRLYALLSPSGRIWITVPNPTAFGHRIFGKSWRGLEPPRHLCLFPPTTLLAMLDNAGFKGARLIRRGAHSPKVVSESVQIVKARGLRPWSRIHMSGLHFIMTVLATVSPRIGEEIIAVARRED
jgi:2-polyprenyl-3-methyl-5-hydroxy-6-metoxy-1,4-benzoquinol methylase